MFGRMADGLREMRMAWPTMAAKYERADSAGRAHGR
jgi:hypothetical protein